MQRINNMGSLLQAYALKRLLETLENQVEFIDIKKIDSDYQLLGDYKQKFKGESEQTGVLGKMKKIDKYTLNRLKIRRLSDEQSSIFEKFRINALNIDKVSNKYDLCVIGSDEVFNCLNAGAWGFTSQLFGNVVEANNVITYAASCGSTKYDELPLEVATCIRETFKRISAFSARDMNGWKKNNFIRNMFGTWWRAFKSSSNFRRTFVLAFYTAMILLRTVLNREIWFDPLGKLFGGWGLYEDGQFTTESIENFMLFVPFSILFLWAFHKELFDSMENLKFGKTIWAITKIVATFSFIIEFLQLLFHLGTFQISDLCYNTLGGTIGGVIYFVGYKFKNEKN